MKKILSLALVAVASVALLLGAIVFGNATDTEASATVGTPVLSANSNSVIPGDDAPTVTVISGGESDYVIIYSGTVSGAYGKAYDLNEFFYSKCSKADLEQKKDTTTETNKEIILGTTDRKLSKDLAAAAYAAAGTEDAYVWGVACKDGQVALYNRGGTYAVEKMYEMLEALIVDNNLVLKDGLMLFDFKTFAEYDKEKQEEADKEAAEKAEERIKKALELYNSHKGSDEFKTQLVFERGEVVDRIVHEDGAELMSTTAFEYPSFTPSNGEHPRILLTSDMLPRLREVLEDPNYSIMSYYFWKHADATNVTGIMPAGANITHKNGTPDDPSDDYIYVNHFGSTAMWQIEAKALAYQLTGDVTYAYEAIGAIKNAILTTRYWTATQQDTYHAYACVMEIAAYVYDWCYDVMTEEDKTQIIDGIRFYLCPYIEFNYPPSNMGYVSGHGTGAQMFRVWITLAAAMADERPDWWAYVGGRFYQYYIPVVNQMYASGFVSQGTNYGIGKWGVQMFSAYMLETMGDTTSMDDGISRKAPYYIMSLLMPNGNFFQTADAWNGVGHTSYGHTAKELAWAFISAALTDDPIMLSYAYDLSNKANDFDYTFTDHITPALMAILVSACDAELSDAGDTSLDLIKYTGFPGGETSIRNSWEENAVALYMKVGDRTMANHDHRDSGHFQIYYKGLLACDSGYYTGVTYGSNHSKYYQQATVAHNGLLVYDPKMSTDKFYSGGQVRVGEASSIEQWNGGKYDFAKIIGHAEGYSQDGSLAKYAYIAGDMTNSYDAASVNYIARHMLTIMKNDDSEIPMVMFIYDDIESDNTEAIKKFLLHTVNEPTVENGRVVAIEGDGKLTLVPLSGVDKIEKIGGADKEYWVGKDAENGYNVIDGIEAYDPNKDLPGRGFIWGRAELSATGESTNRMLNMIFVSDKTSNADISATVIDTDEMLGADIDGSVVLFAKNRTKQIGGFTVNTTGDGLQTYYIAGLKSGVWTVSVSGETLGTVYVSDENAFVTFKAPAGEITIAPRAVENRFPINYVLYDATLAISAPKKYAEGKGLAELPTPTHPAGFKFLGWYDNPEFTGNPVTEISTEATGAITLYAKWEGSRINYLLSGGELAAGAPLYYKHGEGLAEIPAPVHSDGYEFLGWYADATYKNKITFIGTDVTGEFTVYARWKKPPTVYANYDGTSFDRLNGALSKVDLNGENVYQWTTAKDGPIITISTAGESYNVMYGDELAISFTVSLAKVPGKDIINSYCRVINKESGTKEIQIFNINNQGEVKLGKSSQNGTKLFTLTEELQTLRIVLSFETGMLTAYNEEGFVIGELNAALPSGYTSFEEYRQTLNTQISLINWRANCAGSLYIDNLIIEEGNTHLSEEALISKMVDYEANGGTLPADYQKFFKPGEGIATLATPSHPAGLAFLGWYANEDFSGDVVTSIGADVVDNITLYAKWGGSKISYNVGEGTLPAGAAIYFAHGTGLATLPTPTHPQGFEFLGWYDNPEYTGSAVTKIGADVTADVILYAKWGGAYIHYYIGDATLPSGYPTLYVYGVGVAELPIPTHIEGYEFLGWYTESTFVNKVTGIGTDVTGDVNLYARWERDPAVYLETDGSNKSYITSAFRTQFAGIFAPVDTNADGAADALEWSIKDGEGETTMPTISTSKHAFAYSTMYGSEHAISITIDLSTIPGYGIMSTSFRIGGSAIGNIITVFNTSTSGDVKLQGSSKVIGKIGTEKSTLRIVIDFDNSKICAYNEQGAVIDEVSFKAPSFEGKTLTAEEWRQLYTASISLFNWRIQGHDGSTNTDGSVRRYGLYIDSFKIEESDVFASESSDGDGSDSADSSKKITYNANGGVVPTGAVTSFVPGEGLATLPTPTHPNGYEFLGWYDNADFAGTPVTVIGTNVTADVTLYAKWQATPVLYYENDGSAKGTITANFKPGFEGVFAGKDTDSDGTPDAIEWSINDYEFPEGEKVVMPNLSIMAPIAYSTMNGSEHVVSFTVDLAAIAGYGNIVTTFRFGGSAIGGTIEIFKTYADGTVKLKNSSKVICTLGEEMQTLRIAFDFDNAMIYAYDAQGQVIDSVSTKAPSGYASLEEWRQSYESSVQILNWYLADQGTVGFERYGMYIGSLKIEEGNAFD